MKAYFNRDDIKAAKLALVNQELTSFQSAILAQHINDLEYRIKQLIEYCSKNENFELADLYSQPIADDIQKDLLKMLGVEQ